MPLLSSFASVFVHFSSLVDNFWYKSKPPHYICHKWIQCSCAWWSQAISSNCQGSCSGMEKSQSSSESRKSSSAHLLCVVLFVWFFSLRRRSDRRVAVMATVVWGGRGIGKRHTDWLFVVFLYTGWGMLSCVWVSLMCSCNVMILKGSNKLMETLGHFRMFM